MYMYSVQLLCTISLWSYPLSCCGSVDKTTDSQPWGPWFESAGSGSSDIQGKALYPHCLDPWKGLKAVGPLVACL